MIEIWIGLTKLTIYFSRYLPKEQKMFMYKQTCKYNYIVHEDWAFKLIFRLVTDFDEAVEACLDLIKQRIERKY